MRGQGPRRLARLDYTQNAINKTLVAPYSPRAALGAPVSVPISWDELDDPALRPDRWTIRTVSDRLATHGDPFRALLATAQELPTAHLTNGWVISDFGYSADTPFGVKSRVRPECASEPRGTTWVATPSCWRWSLPVLTQPPWSDHRAAFSSNPERPRGPTR